MTRMPMPGYTAEASLYRTSGHYYAGGAPVQVGGAIQPAQQTCQDRCFRCCVSACRADGNPRSWCERLCRSDCEAYGPCWPSSCSSRSGYPTPWVCQQDQATTDPRCQICYRRLSPTIGETYHTC